MREYQDSDFEEIESWGKQWDTRYIKSQLPPTGLIVPGLCAYFMYETNSSVCFLENLISNRSADKELVAKALEEIVPALFKMAKDKGYTVAYACTDNPEVIKRALRVGAAVKASHALMIKDLTR